MTTLAPRKQKQYTIDEARKLLVVKSLTADGPASVKQLVDRLGTNRQLIRRTLIQLIADDQIYQSGTVIDMFSRTKLAVYAMKPEARTDDPDSILDSSRGGGRESL